MKTHPFKPLISKATKKLLVGTLPPENVSFYFSHSSNTRLWDILSAVDQQSNFVSKGGNHLSDIKKMEILDSLGIGITDIIYRYKRDNNYSTKDTDIEPKEYLDLVKLAIDNNITELLFVYQSALKWFVHYLQKEPPVRLKKISMRFNIGPQNILVSENKNIKCTLLPAPLNRGAKGQNLTYKLAFYKTHILDL
jgi:G:T/U-mismatch repair DNA glycosylase